MRRIARLCLYGGVLVIVGVLAWVHARYIGDYPLTDTSRFAWTWVYLAVLWLSAYAVGLPDHPDRAASLRSAVLAALLGPLIFSLIQAAVGSALLPRFVVASSVLPLFALYAATGAMHRRTTASAASRDAVLAVLDAPSEEDDLANDVRASALRPASLRTIVSSAQVAELGGLPSALEHHDANVLVLDRMALGHEWLVDEAAALHQRGLRVRSVTDFYEEWIGKMPHRELEQSVLLFDIAELHDPGYRRLSRLVDVMVGLAGAVLLVVVTPFVLLGNLVANRGSLLYRQSRVGRAGEKFQILKFRTMRGGQEASEWTSLHDDRVTPFGRLLRASHLDELPQFVNILRGDLSIVGPRPEQPQYVEQLSEKIPFYQLRHLVRPGLTGWAQVNYPYGANEQDALEKLQHEFWYLRHQSVWLDLSIMVKTLRQVVGLRGR